MARYLFRLPDVGEGVAEAEIVAWHVRPGDLVKEDQSLVDVMTDKATVDMTSPVDGRILAVHGEIGAMCPVGAILVEFEVDGAGNATEAETEAVQPSVHASEPQPAGAASERAATDAAPEAPPAMRATEPALLASPATRRRAHERGVPLQFVAGTGPGGRITGEDLDAFVANGGAGAAGDTRYAPRTGVVETRIIGLRRKIAEKMQEAKRRIPHIAYVEEVDVTELEALRGYLNAHKRNEQPKLTLLPFLIRALVRALSDFPRINARYDDDNGVLHVSEGVHVGIATQTDAGLMVPVVRHAESRDIWGLAAEIARISRAARDGTAQRAELSGSTITVTSLGALGGVVTTPVINHPEVAIIGPNKIVDRPVVDGSFVTVRKRMNLSSSFDHRIVDGYDAALFVQRLARMIEHPALIFMD